MSEQQAGGSALQGRKAVVTGGGSGIGLGLIERFVSEGAAALAVDIDESSGQRVQDAGASFVPADVAEPADWARVVETASRELGGIDLLVLNAAVPVLEPDVVAAPYERVQRAWSVNVEGVVHGLRAAVGEIEASGGGDVVIVASLAGLMPYADDPYYAMTKHAVVGLGLSAAPSLEARGVRVTIFCPGVVDTPIVPAHVREAVAAAGLSLLSPAEAASHMLAALQAGGTGRVWLSQAHLGLVEHQPSAVRLPRPKDVGATPDGEKG